MQYAVTNAFQLGAAEAEVGRWIPGQSELVSETPFSKKTRDNWLGTSECTHKGQTPWQTCKSPLSGRIDTLWLCHRVWLSYQRKSHG